MLPHDTTPIGVPSKICIHCKAEKPATIEFFGRDSRMRSGLENSCKKCRAEQQRLRREAANWETQRAYYSANKERLTQQDRERKRANRARYNAYNRAYYYRSKEQGKVIPARSKEKILAKVHRRRAMKINAPGSHTEKDVASQYEAQKGRCYWCDCEVGKKYHADHVIPLSRGGSDGPENIVIACVTCNTSKVDKLPTEWDGNKTRRLL